jgi:zinc finger SWIM domain-containing protein 3
MAYEFYNTYAGHVGFSVRKFWHDKSSTNVIRTKKFVCSKSGYKDQSSTSGPCQRKRADTRVGCKAEMTIKISEIGKYVVSSFEDAHNHELVTPSKAHLLRSQRRITEAQKAQIDILNDSGIRPKSGHEAMSRQAGVDKVFASLEKIIKIIFGRSVCTQSKKEIQEPFFNIYRTSRRKILLSFTQYK